MSRTVSMEILVLISLLACAFPCYAEAATQCASAEFKCSNGRCIPIRNLCDRGDDCEDNSDEQVCDAYHCHPLAFQCFNGKCITRKSFCDAGDHCQDYSDERYCNIGSSFPCPPGWIRCPSGSRCILASWVCDGLKDCKGESEETNCGNNTAKMLNYTAAKLELKSLFLRRRKPGSITDRWGSQVHRIAVALHLVDNSTFEGEKRTGEEIRYELTTQLLHRLAKDRKMSSQELALYIHALLVACMDPRDFYGDDLVRELRRRVEAKGNYTNPFLILALCNAGDTMTARDVESVTAAYDAKHRPFWIDSQALASMALSCISSRSSVSVDERTLRDMLQELKRRQFRNGTVDNFRTTALVTQALFIHDSYKKDFDLDSAMKVLTDGLNGSKSLLDTYYALPVLSRKSLLNVTSGHCRKEPVAGIMSVRRPFEFHVTYGLQFVPQAQIHHSRNSLSPIDVYLKMDCLDISSGPQSQFLTRVLHFIISIPLVQRSHPIRHGPLDLPKLPTEIRSPFNRLLMLWGNRKSSSIRNDMPNYFINKDE
ncbi:Low-density lipoprotein receptor-related protein [Araneus ventricosus]|uniref:Low-density lipoprotein receptor-related protein n=1 Tax=Araneus ventricosus TaxID=182803 RepID=A0A4Y2M7M6_ARAVE|nr:Low-density lipoprotein receptor-related protein [Araneus ventricosus]